MKYTHEVVRRVMRKAQIPTGAPNSEAREDDLAIVELCEEWLARRTVRWTGNSLIRADGKDVGSTFRGGDGKEVAWFGYNDDDPEETFATKAEARAWLEAKADRIERGEA